MKQPAKLYVCGFDLHFPYHCKATVAAMFDFVRRNKVDGFIFGGDQFHNDEISHHTQGKGLFRPAGAFKRNEERFDKEILTPLEKMLPKADLHWLIGNHDRWETDMDEANPELAGCFDRTKNLNLQKRGWTIVDSCKSMQLGKLVVCHGDSLSSGFGVGAFPTRKAIDVYMKSVLFGHVHYAQSFAKVSPLEVTQRYMSWASPCLCKCNPGYAKNRPNNWVNGFSLVYVRPNGNFNVYPVIVSGGAAVYAGQVYSK